MKNISVRALTLLLVTNSFASEGDADALAGSIFSIIGIIFAIFIFSYIVVALCELAEAVGRLWQDSTTVGRLVIFGIPLSAVSTGIFCVIFYYVFPAVAAIYPFLVNSITGNIIVGLVLELILVAVGWNAVTGNKRSGRFATISRFIVLLPMLPVIYGLYYTVQLFKMACLKEAVVDFNPYIVRKEPHIL
jgi:hypothetical protein